MAGKIAQLCLIGLRTQRKIALNFHYMPRNHFTRNICVSNVLPAELRFSKSHEWIAAEEGEGKVGITDYAEQQLGDIVYVELPEVGTELEREGEFGVVESVKAASDIYSPVSGTVVEVNEDLSENPEIINKSPFDQGWIMKLKLSNPSELEELMTEEQYKEYIKE